MMNIIDNNFYNLVNELKALDKNEIYDNINKYLDKIPIQTRFELEDYFESIKDEYDEILNRADILKNHIEDFVFLYNNLYDSELKVFTVSLLIESIAIKVYSFNSYLSCPFFIKSILYPLYFSNNSSSSV